LDSIVRLLWPYHLDAKSTARQGETNSETRETLHETNQPETPDSSKNKGEKGEAQKVGEAAEIYARRHFQNRRNV